MAGVYVGDDLARYGFGDGHPFGHDRLDAFWNEALNRGLNRDVTIFSPVSCAAGTLGDFHTDDYVELLRRSSIDGSGFLDYGDTPAFAGVLDAVMAVAGSGLDAVEKLVSGEMARIFIPIGGLHHARRHQAAGFCAINDIGILITTLRSKYGIRRIAYVDIDAHHGDGVQYSFNSDPELFFADIHEDGRFLYPGTGFAHETGEGDAKGTKLNLPVMPDSRDDVFHAQWPVLEEFIRASQPEMILFQAGADSIAGDPITHMKFTPDAHAHAARQLCRIANEHCDGKIIAWGGGGYNRANIANAWCEVVQAMIETEQ